jgi:hypothetical protein
VRFFVVRNTQSVTFSTGYPRRRVTCLSLSRAAMAGSRKSRAIQLHPPSSTCILLPPPASSFLHLHPPSSTCILLCRHLDVTLGTRASGALWKKAFTRCIIDTSLCFPPPPPPPPLIPFTTRWEVSLQVNTTLFLPHLRAPSKKPSFGFASALEGRVAPRLSAYSPFTFLFY